MNNKYFIVFLLLAVILSGCAVAEPYVRDFNIVSVSQEKELGQKMTTEVAKEMTLSQNSADISKVRTLGNRLAQALPKREFDYQFYVVENSSPNAFTIPGGIIYVHTGLMTFVDNEAQLAGVIAHEVGHAYERHPAKSLSLAYGIDAVTSLITKDNSSSLKKMTLDLAKGGLLLRYSRQDETEADEMAFFLLKKAGYPTSGLLQFMKKLATMETSKLPTIFRSHPPTAERIAHLEALERGDAKLSIKGFIS